MTDRALQAHTVAEVRLTLRNGESLLLTMGIPVLLLVFFSLVDVLPTDTPDPVDFLAPGVLALAVLSTAMVNLAIATGFQRSYLVLKRLGATPLGRPRLLAAKTAAVGVVLAVQLVVLLAVGLGLGWRPAGGASAVAAVVIAVVLATAAFAGIGMLLAGTLRAEVDAGRRERPLPRAVAAWRRRYPARQAAGLAPRRHQPAARRRAL